MARSDLQEVYRRRVERYARVGGACLLSIGLVVVAWSWSGVSLWMPAYFGIPYGAYLMVVVSAGFLVLIRERNQLRCPRCEAVLPRQASDGCVCDQCHARWGARASKPEPKTGSD
ncbi:MAG: hypothetical protein HY319_05295 [Armatimonadetes bacterium]|nr:hypothetical protein [Armatimonadota bacterium]